MCGCNNINGMKRRKRISGLGDAGSIAMTGATLAVGFLLANFVTKQLGAGSAKYANLIKIGGGLAIASMTKGSLSTIGVGVVTSGITDIGQGALDAAGINLLPPGAPARYLAGFQDGSTFDGQQFPFRGFP